MQPNWPTFHVFNQVIACRNNSALGCKHNLQLSPLNDANAIFEYPTGTYHVMNQGATYGDVNGARGITGVSWKHAVSDDLVRWYRLPDALGPQPNTSWGKSGACDGDFSHPVGQGPIITWGPDCGDPLPPPQQQQRLHGARPLDFPRVAVARPADPSSTLLSEWIPGAPVVFDADSPPCAFAGPVWKSSVGDYFNMVCVSPVDTRIQVGRSTRLFFLASVSGGFPLLLLLTMFVPLHAPVVNLRALHFDQQHIADLEAGRPALCARAQLHRTGSPKPRQLAFPQTAECESRRPDAYHCRQLRRDADHLLPREV
jgi:hypothetical protein